MKSFSMKNVLKKYIQQTLVEWKASKFFFNSNWLPDNDDFLREFHYATVKMTHAKA